jgi:O-acetyl-ADP-ribose deacetylase (regulator of RNase III)
MEVIYISDTARVQLAAIKTFLKTNKNSEIKNIYIVMDDEESYKTYQEYYSRIFV